MNPFIKACKERIKLRILLQGTSGTGKTYTALRIATRIAELDGGRVAVLDTEGRSARRYATEFDFDVLDLSLNYNPSHFINAIHSAALNNYSVLIVDSFTHAWNGAGGVLSIVDDSAKRNNKFSGWAVARPAHKEMINAIINSDVHIIGTTRSQPEWLVETDKMGQVSIKKVGMGGIQDKEFEYEFDICGDMSHDHTMTISKSRCNAINDSVITDYDALGSTLHEWATNGVEPPPQMAGETYLATQDGRDRLRGLLDELHVDNFEYYLAHLQQQDKPISKFGETTLRERELHNRIRYLHTKKSAPAPEELAPEELAPEELAPEELAPEELAPEELAPEELAPEEVYGPDASYRKDDDVPF